MSLTAPLGAGEGVAITLERAAGSSQPTMQRVLLVTKDLIPLDARSVQTCDIFDGFSIRAVTCRGIGRAGDCQRHERTSSLSFDRDRALRMGERGQSEPETSRRPARLDIQGRHGARTG